jgi:hypothetical protein
MKKVYIIATPSGRSIISMRNNPRKAFHKSKISAMERLKSLQKSFKVRLKIQSLMLPVKAYPKHF